LPSLDENDAKMMVSYLTRIAESEVGGDVAGRIRELALTFFYTPHNHTAFQLRIGTRPQVSLPMTCSFETAMLLSVDVGQIGNL